MLRANFHTHSTFCDGTSTAEEMVQQALDLDFFDLGFSGHMDTDVYMNWDDYYREIRRLQAAYASRLDIILGAELDICFDPATCADAEYVIGSTHYIPASDGTLISVDYSEEVLAAGCRDYFGGDWYAFCRAYYELEAQVYTRTHCTFVGHFDLITRFNDSMHFVDETDPAYLTPALEAMEHLVSQGVPFEINCGAINRGRKAEPYPRRELMQALHDFGGEILISSDAHQRELLNGGFEQAIQEAIECGFTHTNVLGRTPAGGLEFRQLALDTL